MRIIPFRSLQDNLLAMFWLDTVLSCARLRLPLVNARPLSSQNRPLGEKSMKKIRQVCICLALTIVLALSAFAGEIPFPGATNPPPPPQSTVTGDISTPGITATGEISTTDVAELDPVTEAALSLLQSILSLF